MARKEARPEVREGMAILDKNLKKAIADMHIELSHEILHGEKWNKKK